MFWYIQHAQARKRHSNQMSHNLALLTSLSWMCVLLFLFQFSVICEHPWDYVQNSFKRKTDYMVKMFQLITYCSDWVVPADLKFGLQVVRLVSNLSVNCKIRISIYLAIFILNSVIVVFYKDRYLSMVLTQESRRWRSNWVQGSVSKRRYRSRSWKKPMLGLSFKLSKL